MRGFLKKGKARLHQSVTIGTHKNSKVITIILIVALKKEEIKNSAEKYIQGRSERGGHKPNVKIKTINNIKSTVM